MPAHSPIDILAEELGAVAGRIEREAQLRIDAAIADIARRDAERELRMVQLERRMDERLAALKDGAPGASVTVEDVAPVIATEVARQVASLPPAEADKSVTIEDVRPMLQAMVDAMPKAERGLPGASVTVDDVAPMIEAAIGERIASLPPAEAGRSVTIEDVRPILQAMVDALPKAKDGASVTLDDVAPLIDAEVARRIASLPPAEPGRSVTVEELRPVLQAMVDALPPPERGPAGERGPQGRLPVAKQWEDRVHYEGELAVYDGSTYQASKDTGRTPPHDDWLCIAKAGADGVSLNFEGTFDAARLDYRRLNVVALNGGTFAARRDNPGPCPGDGWQLVASPGKRGQPGERGPAGAAGPRGLPGPPVVGLSIEGEAMLTLVNGDGTTAQVDLYPLLDKLQ